MVYWGKYPTTGSEERLHKARFFTNCISMNYIQGPKNHRNGFSRFSAENFVISAEKFRADSFSREFGTRYGFHGEAGDYLDPNTPARRITVDAAQTHRKAWRAGKMKLLTALFAVTDEQAMWRVQMHDDAEAFGQLVARWQAPIKRLCVRMLGDDHKAEDACQEAFARVYAKRKDFQHGAKFSTFLWRVATNLCLDELRRIKRRREFSPFGERDGTDERDIWEEMPGATETPDHCAAEQEDAVRVRQALMELPDHYRSVVVLRHYEDLKFREIAEVLGIPEGTVKSRMAEALSLLAHALRTSGPDGRPGTNPRRRDALLL